MFCGCGLRCCFILALSAVLFIRLYSPFIYLCMQPSRMKQLQVRIRHPSLYFIHLNICGILVLSDRMEVGMSFVVWNGFAMK